MPPGCILGALSVLVECIADPGQKTKDLMRDMGRGLDHFDDWIDDQPNTGDYCAAHRGFGLKMVKSPIPLAN